MKIDGSILVSDPRDAGPRARRLEECGYDGGFTFEGPHDPFLPLVVAAEHTERLQLQTAIAVAFARNPMSLANLGYDLQLHSRGRFMLGLGSQIRPHIERRFSSVWSRPAARMRELVLAVRAIWESWEHGTPLDFRGEFYTHTLMTPFFNPGANPFGNAEIFLAGVGPRMTEAAGEVADGLLVHPFHTPRFLEQITRPALARGFARGKRDPENFVISCQLIVATGSDEEELEAAKRGARTQIAFYASTPAYRPVLDCHERGELQRELNVLSKLGDWEQMAERIDDELLEMIAVVAPRDELPAKLSQRVANFAQRVSLVAPYGPDPVEWPEVLHALKQS